MILAAFLAPWLDQLYGCFSIVLIHTGSTTVEITGEGCVHAGKFQSYLRTSGTTKLCFEAESSAYLKEVLMILLQWVGDGHRSGVLTTTVTEMKRWWTASFKIAIGQDRRDTHAGEK